MLAFAFLFTPLAEQEARSEDLSDLTAQLLQDPQNTELNLRYARAAVAAGKPRLALAAYERILLNDPDNEEAQQRYARLRRQIQPPQTSLRLVAGERWDSNAYNDSANEIDASTSFFIGTMLDERPIFGRRWRTSAAVEAEYLPEARDLDYGYAGIQAGPMFELGPRVTMIPSLGVSVASLSDKFYYNEVAATLALEGRIEGLSPWGRVRVGYRDYAKQATADNGVYIEAMGGATVNHITSDADRVTVAGWTRWSDIDGSAKNLLNEDIVPGMYTEYGLEVAYSYEVSSHLTLGTAITGRQRDYRDSSVGGEDRSDTYVAPEASATVTRVLPCNCAIRVSYRYRDNSSNDSFYDYDGEQVSAAFIARF
ncbi:MAG: tetratricopeptide repeat protein [Hyphomonadaceae bacterium]